MSIPESACTPLGTCESTTPRTSLWQIGRHISQLDGVRGFAILIVTLYRFSKEIPTDSAVGKFLHTLFAFGDRGVDLFFVLSGFLITGILVDAKGQDGYFKNFFARRSLRIFPLYFAALFLFLVVLNWLAPGNRMFVQATENQFFLWTYMANIKMSLEGAWCFGSLDHFWSLAVEEHFYLVWPFVIFFVSPRTAMRLALGFAALSSISRIGYAMLSTNGVAPDLLTIFRCDALLIGAALALQIRSATGLRPLLRWTYLVFPFALAIGVACAVLDKRVFTISHTLWPLVFACVLIWLLNASESSLLGRFFNLAALRKLGQYSYAMYVFQSPLMPIVASVLSVSILSGYLGNAILANLVYMAAMFGLSYGAALLSWHVLESHCLKLKKWFESQAPAKPSSDHASSLASLQGNR